jgi:flagellar biosynthetic protein FlhB
MSGSSEDRTEKATPKKRKKARRDGQIGNSHELGTWLGLLAATFLLPRLARSILDNGSASLVQLGAIIRKPDVGTAITAAHSAASSALRAALPLGLTIAAVGVVSVALQGGIWFSPKAFKPQAKRLNPLSGVKRMFGPQAGWQLVKSLGKIAALALVVFVAIRHLIPQLYGSGSMSMSALLSTATGTALSVLRYAAIGGVILALADFAVVKKRNNKSLKMTKKEVKDEHKSTEGDPHIRGQRRARALAMARNRMMSDVPTADVVVVNPTHVAVALRYDPKRGAPRVVAKGADNVAAKIRELAEAHRVPMVRDVPLARTLHETCDIGQEIPPELYRAVATVLAFIMTLRKRGSAAGTHTVRTLPPAVAAAR